MLGSGEKTPYAIWVGFAALITRAGQSHIIWCIIGIVGSDVIKYTVVEGVQINPKAKKKTLGVQINPNSKPSKTTNTVLANLNHSGKAKPAQNIQFPPHPRTHIYPHSRTHTHTHTQLCPQTPTLTLTHSRAHRHPLIPTPTHSRAHRHPHPHSHPPAVLLALHLKKAQVALPQLLAPMVLKLAGLLVLVQVPHRCYWNLSNQTQKILIMTNCVLSVAGCNAELQHSFRCVYLGCGFGAAQTGRSMCASMEMHMHTRTPSPKHTHTNTHTHTHTHKYTHTHTHTHTHTCTFWSHASPNHTHLNTNTHVPS